jgi:D-galactarolactone cycloisomerase
MNATLPPRSDLPLTISRIEARVYRCPIDRPVTTSFGTMTERPMVLVRLLDSSGAHGWGEAWCNFPAVGAEHRARLVDSVLAPITVGRRFESPRAMFDELTRATAVLAIQSGEPGPIAQAIAAVDLAAWDLVARRASLPLWRLLGGRSDRVPVYASGLNPDSPERLATERRRAGHTRFKLKVGFGEARDLANLRALRAALGDAVLMVDANQGWTPAQAGIMLDKLAPFGLEWIEEPLRADRPWIEWQRLALSGAAPLAAGENLAGLAAFDEALASGVLAVVQPDAAKWGGISANLDVIAAIADAGRRYCPHYLGGGVGLLASAHLLAGTGGDGWLEIDANPNPLRSLLEGPIATIEAGTVALGDAPGIGIAELPAELERFRVSH